MFENINRLADEMDNLAVIAKSTHDPALQLEVQKFVDQVKNEVDKGFSDVHEILGKVAYLKSSELNEDRVRDLQKELSDTYSKEKFKKLLKICDRLHILAERYRDKIQPHIETEFRLDSSHQLFWLLHKHEGAFMYTIRNAVEQIINSLDSYRKPEDFENVRKQARSGQNELREILDKVVNTSHMFIADLKGGTSTLLSPYKDDIGNGTAGDTITKDVFICHASDDKDLYIRPLVEKLEEHNITCWYDEAEIRWGDSIVRKVNEGLRSSKFVLVALSLNSIKKHWPNNELEAALNIEFSSGKTKVLPLMIGSDNDERKIKEHYPILSSKLYLKLSSGVDEIVSAMLQRIS